MPSKSTLSLTFKFFPILILLLISFFISDNLRASFQPQVLIDDHLKYPENILLLDPYFRPNVFIVEKSIHRLHLYSSENGLPKYQQSYIIATGLTSGNKKNQGDLKTPEGIYQLINFIPEESLLKIYGNEGRKYGRGAFVTDYPNFIDRMSDKNGNGIWLHATDDESRLEKGLDSKGCVVVDNKNLVDLARYIKLNNSVMIIVRDLAFLHGPGWNAKKDELTKFFSDWLEAWKVENFQRYISFYHPLYQDSTRSSFQALSQYKDSVFKNPGTPIIETQGLSILAFKDYALILFEQIYKSNTIVDSGMKTLYLKKDDNYKWKIINESWRKKDGPTVPFQPKQYYFK